MSPLPFVVVVFGGALLLYLIFLGIGFVGIPENRRAQGLEREPNKRI